MRRRGRLLRIFVLSSALATQATVLFAQGGAAATNLTAAEPMGPVENLTVYPVPPEGFNAARENIPHGEVKLVEYDSKIRCPPTAPVAASPACRWDRARP